MYGAEDVFAMEKSTFMKWAASLGVPVFASIFVVFSRLLLTWYYTIFVIIFILVLIFKDLIFVLVKKIKNWWKARKFNDSNTVNADTTNNELKNPN